MRRFLPALMLPLLLPSAAPAQFQLTVPKIMRGYENTGHEPVSDGPLSPDPSERVTSVRGDIYLNRLSAIVADLRRRGAGRPGQVILA